VKSNQRAIQCDFCDHWTHLSCTTLSRPKYELLSTSDDTFYCYSCSQRLPNFSDSFFDTSVRNQSGNCTTDFNHTGSSQIGSSAFSDVNSDSEIENEHYDIFIELSEPRKKHPNNFTCAYLNVNSIRYTFCSIKELLTKNTIDMLIIAETKLDESYPDALFKVDNYHFWRKDRMGEDF